MNDPHVKELRYTVETDPTDDFSRALAVRFDDSRFSGMLSGHGLVLEPKNHYASERDARAVADEFLRSWELYSGLLFGRTVIGFRFCGSQLIDRSPSPNHVELVVSDAIHMVDRAKVFVGHASYPSPPPPEFLLGDELEVLWKRYMRYKSGAETIQTAAYFSLTYLEYSAGGDRRAASTKYGVDKAVLDKIGELSSNRGDELTARKMHAATTSLSSTESSWMDSAILAMMKRLARMRSDPLTMSDLPRL